MSDASPRGNRSVWVWATPCSILGACLIGSRFPAVVEHHYAESLAPRIQRALGILTEPFTFGLGELLVALFLLFGVARAGHLVRRCVSGSLEPRAAARRTGRVIGLLAIWLLAAFYLLWGLHYSRQPAHERLGWERVEASEWRADATELRALAIGLTHAVNQSYVRLHGSTDRGSPTPAADLSQVHEALEQGYVTAHEALSLTPSLAQPHGHAKPLASSPLFSRLGIAGIYFPFTGEANFNKDIPSWTLPHVIAHEKAHQRGIASEDEANFFGLLACLYAPLPEVQYSGLLFAQRQVAGALLRIEPEDAIRIIKQRHPGVQRDVNAHRAFWMGHRGALTDVGSAFNDTYLKLNGVTDGTDSYRESLLLIAALFRDDAALSALPDYVSKPIVTGHPTSSPDSVGSSSSS